jgi:hypothetical protein
MLAIRKGRINESWFRGEGRSIIQLPVWRWLLSKTSKDIKSIPDMVANNIDWHRTLMAFNDQRQTMSIVPAVVFT